MDYNELQQKKQDDLKKAEKQKFLGELVASATLEIDKMFKGLVGAVNSLKSNLFSVKVTNPVTSVKAEITNFPKQNDEVSVKEAKELLNAIQVVAQAVRDNKVIVPEVKIPTSVSVNNLKDIPQTKLEVKETSVDTSGLEDLLKALLKEAKKTKETRVSMPTIAPRFEMKNDELIKAVEKLEKALNIEVPATDLSPIIESTQQTTDAIKNLRFPVPNVASSWQHSLSMQSEDLPLTIAWKTAGGKVVPDYREFTANDGNTYRKTYLYDTNGRSIGWTGWEK